jgi:glycosyltransferase involved in cell wall biosynthesis
MGGNTKILVEIINYLSDKFDFVIFTTEPKAFEINLKDISKVKIIPIAYPFRKFSYASHYAEIQYIKNIYLQYFLENKIDKDDYFFTPSDFGPDVMPVSNLRKKYKFKWIASLFLFIPDPIGNILKGYKFPFIKYVIYYLYQKYIFSRILKNADLFLITNDYDRKYFPTELKKRIFAIYGGVNVEQIEIARKKWDGKKIYDAVFCSRLHPQKGISQLLDIWSMVIKEIPKAKLVIIGNGEEAYEKFLKEKAVKLGIERNINWLGYINGVVKYKIYLQSKIFLHGTIYDNNGMVAAEALCTGLPVIMYDLPQLKKVYNSGCIKVKIREEYVKQILRILKKEYILKLKTSEFIEHWNWRHNVDLFSNFLKLR